MQISIIKLFDDWAERPKSETEQEFWAGWSGKGLIYDVKAFRSPAKALIYATRFMCTTFLVPVFAVVVPVLALIFSLVYSILK